MAGAMSPLLVTEYEEGHHVNKRQQQQAFIRFYREQTGESEVDMHKVADFALARGWTPPKPHSTRDLLASEFSAAAREEIKQDAKTGRPYRANHAYSIRQGDTQLFLWVDIDEATRPQMRRSITNRREQIVGDVVQLAFDVEHWNRINASQDPLVVPTDFTDDLEWRKNSPDEVGA
jgi:hypothetical protein